MNGSVLLVESDPEELARMAGWVEREGFEAFTCPGPTEPEYTCIGSRGGTCPLASAASVVVLDMSLDSDVVMLGTAAEDLLGLYLLGGHRVIALGSRRDDEISGTLCRLDRHPRRDQLLAAIRSLAERRRDPVSGADGTVG